MMPRQKCWLGGFRASEDRHRSGYFFRGGGGMSIGHRCKTRSVGNLMEMFQRKRIAYFEQGDRAPNHSPALPLTGPFKVRPFLSFRLREAFALAVCPYVDGWRGHQIYPSPRLSLPRCWLKEIFRTIVGSLYSMSLTNLN